MGDNAVLTCTVTKFDKTPVVEWYKGATKLTTSKELPWLYIVAA